MEKIEELKEFILERKRMFIIGGLLVLSVIFICSYFIIYNTSDNNEIMLEENIIEEKEDINENTKCSLKVDIKGEIKKPGLYELECNNRVLDVINLAGGLTSKADTSVLNLGKKVIDEMVIVILSKDQVNNYEKEKEIIEHQIENCNKEVINDACIKNENIYINENQPNINIDSNNSNNENSNDKEIIGDTPVNSLVSLNKATLEELMTLSGIGKTKAESIIKYREENNGFKTLEELKNVKGIGDSTFEKIKGNITL